MSTLDFAKITAREFSRIPFQLKFYYVLINFKKRCVEMKFFSLLNYKYDILGPFAEYDTTYLVRLRNAIRHTWSIAASGYDILGPFG